MTMTRHRILVVEDDSSLATLYQSALAFAGFDVAVAGDGLAALEGIDEDHPDLVVLDLQLPQIDGGTILREVAATPDTRDIPIIVVTGSDANGLPPASVVLRKPFDPGELVAAIEQQLH